MGDTAEWRSPQAIGTIPKSCECKRSGLCLAGLLHSSDYDIVLVTEGKIDKIPVDAVDVLALALAAMGTLLVTQK